MSVLDYPSRAKKCFLLTLIHKANLSICLGIRDAERTIYQVLHGEKNCGDCIYTITENLNLIPSNLDLAGAEIELSSEAGREVILREALSEVKSKYDYIIIDCAPSLGLLTINALTASNEIMIPIQAQYLSLHGISKMTTVIDKIKKRLNHELVIGGVIITQFDARRCSIRTSPQPLKTILKKKFSQPESVTTWLWQKLPVMGRIFFAITPNQMVQLTTPHYAMKFYIDINKKLKVKD